MPVVCMMELHKQMGFPVTEEAQDFVRKSCLCDDCMEWRAQHLKEEEDERDTEIHHG